MLTVDQLRQIAPRCDAEALTPILNSVATRYDIGSLLRFSHWLAQMHEETGGFTAFVENLNYSSDGLMRVWPSHFTSAFAQVYAHHPQSIANRAYANRMGNGDEDSGDGWRYRGRGELQITGRNAYAEAEKETDLPLVDNPDLLLGIGSPGIETAAAFWVIHGCNPFADRNDIVGITRIVNGGLTNLSTRQATHANVIRVLQAPAWVSPVVPKPKAPDLPIVYHEPPKPAVPAVQAAPAVTIPAAGALNVGSVVRMGLGALAVWLINHHILLASGQQAEFVNAAAPFVVAGIGLAWIAIKNRYHLQNLVNALYAHPPTT